MAVEKERAIAENELANRIELTRREEELVTRSAANELSTPPDAPAGPRADEIDVVEARQAAHRARAGRDPVRACRPRCCSPSRCRQLAGQLGQIDHLTITPDLLQPLLSRANGNGG